MARITVVHVGFDGDEYAHSFSDAEFTSNYRDGFITVVGTPTNGYDAGRGPRTEHYPADRVVRIVEAGMAVFAKTSPIAEVES